MKFDIIIVVLIFLLIFLGGSSIYFYNIELTEKPECQNICNSNNEFYYENEAWYTEHKCFCKTTRNEIKKYIIG